MRTIQAALVVALVSLVAARRPHRPHDPCFQAFKRCDWEFKGFRGKIPVFPVNTPPDRAFTPQVISKNKKEVIGILNTNNVIPEFIIGKHPVVITKFGHPRFTPTHFKPYAIDYVMGSGVGHQTFQGNQKRVARGKCVRVFFTTYQLLVHGHPPRVENINVGRHAFKCVVFRLH